MNARSLIVIVLALVCGISAVFLVKALRKPEVAQVIERTGVVFVVADVMAGETIVEKMLELREFPTGQVPEGAIRKIADAVDRVAQTPLDKGDLLRERKVAPRGAGQGVAMLIPEDMRAAVVQVPNGSALTSNIRRKDRVDVLLSQVATSNGGNPPTAVSSQLLLQDIEVFMVGSLLDPNTTAAPGAAPKSNPDSVTLLVKPSDAIKLAEGRNRGTLDIALRNPKARGREKEEVVKPIKFEGLAAKIAPGMRALTLDAASFSSSLAGFLVPDNRVDVLLTSNPNTSSSKTNSDGGSTGVTIDRNSTSGTGGFRANDDPSGGAATTTILENIRILEIQAKPEITNLTKDNAIDGRTVTLEVSPEDAEILDLGQSIGKLHLSLRNSKDEGANAGQRDFRGRWRTLHVAGGLKMIEGPHILPKVQSRDQIRTLRGTRSGADSWTIYETTPRAPVRQSDLPANLAGAK